MKLKRILFIVFIVAVALSGCNIDYLEEALNSYDEDTSDLRIEWNDDKTIRTAYDSETNEVLWYETWEYDASSNPLLVRRYSPDDQLKWSTLYKWVSGLKIQEVCYDAANNLLWYSVFTYNSEGLITGECNYDDANLLQWFEVYEYSGVLNINRARYNSSSEMTDGFLWEYDGSDRKIKETHYTGSTSRNSAGLSYPTAGAAPAYPPFSSSGLSIADWTMWSYDSYGYFKMKFDDENYPTGLYREDSRMTRALTVELDYYSGHVPKSKITSYGSDVVLDVQLTYNSNGYLSEVDTTGLGLLIPLRYEISYNSDLSINRLSVYQSTTKLMYFTYSTAVRPDLDVHPLDPIGFTGSDHTITQYDGDDTKLGSYVVAMEDADTLKIQARDRDDNLNGHFIAEMDAEGEVARFESWSAAGVLQWHYDYDYTEIAGEIMRTAEEKYDDIAGAVEDFTSIDISTLTLDMLFN